MNSILLADIGGTNSRFGLATLGGRPERIEILQNDTMPDLEGAIAHYLAHTGAQPRSAVLAIAGPIGGGDEVTLTNRSWRFRRSALARRFGFEALRVINDFEAIAWALLRLDPPDARPLGPAIAPRDGVKVTLGPGTGLGAAALMPVNGRWHVLSSEGGHAAFGPQEADEFEVFARLQQTHGVVSVETILSGPGLVRLMAALDPATHLQAPEAVVAAALAGDASARATTQLFVRLLGRFSGSLALTFMALGGVYIAGGVASRLGSLIDETAFRAAFEAHPPYRKLMKTIPSLLMSRTEPGLLGCAVVAEEFIGQ